MQLVTRGVGDIVALNIRQFSERKLMSLNMLADLSGVSRSQLYSVLAGNSSPSLDWLSRIAGALEIEPWRLLREA